METAKRAEMVKNYFLYQKRPSLPKMQAIRQGGLCFLLLNLCVYGYNFLPVCLSILRHGFRRATSFSKEANEAITCCIGSFGKGTACRTED